MKHKNRISLAVSICMLSLLAVVLVGPVSAATKEEIEGAIEAGLVWLGGQQDLVDGHWGEYAIAETAFAVLKFETYAIETNQLNDEGKIVEIMVGGIDYYPNVEAGLEYLLANAATLNLIDPDGNGDGLAVYFGYGGTYDISIAMMAIAASTHPENTATISGGEMTYEQILQDALDYLVFGQNDGAGAGSMRGGWGYAANEVEWSDQSNTGYVTLALAYAQAAAPYGFELEIPQIAKDELSIWIDTVQCDDGGSKYSPGWDDVDPNFWENTLKTGNLLFEMALVGDTKDTPRVQDAITYIQNHWYDTDLITGWGWNDPTGPAVAQYQAAYCLMKGLEAMNVELDEIPGVADWYQDLADVIVPQQTVDGYWPESLNYVWPDGSDGPMADTVLSTEWALLTLEKAAPPVGVIPVYVDIRPASWPNPLELKDKGVLPVAICGTEDFDVTTIDPATIRLTLEGLGIGVAPLRWSYEDVATPYLGEPCSGHDLDGDGYLDLTLKFKAQEVIKTLGLDTFSNGDVVILILTGNLKEEYGSMPIQGQDCIVILNK